MADQIYRGLKGDLQKQIDAKADNTTNFADASTRSNIASGETMPTILGKIKKWFGDLKDLAFVAKDGTSSTKFLRGDGTWQIPLGWAFTGSVTSTTGEEIIIPNDATYIMVILIGIDSQDTWICNSVEYPIGLLTTGVELHGTYASADHWVKCIREMNTWLVSDANTVATVFYR